MARERLVAVPGRTGERKSKTGTRSGRARAAKKSTALVRFAGGGQGRGVVSSLNVVAVLANASLSLLPPSDSQPPITLTCPLRTRGPSLGAALSGATTAEAAAEAPRSGAPEGPTSCFFATGTMMRPRFCGVGAEEEEEEEEDEEAADATIVAER